MADEKKSDELIYLSQEWMSLRVPACHHEIDSMFEDLIHRAWGRPVWRPAVDILETVSAYVVRVDLPGVDEEKLEIHAERECLTVEGRRSDPEIEGASSIQVRERPEGRFSRIIQFPAGIDTENIRKQFIDGVLTLIVTKMKQGVLR